MALKLDNCHVNDGQNIANCFNTYFANIANSLSANHKVESQYQPSQKFLSFIQEHLPAEAKFSIPLVRENYVKEALLNINHKKASGADEINSFLLKRVAHIVARPLSELFNNSIRNGCFPDLWKRARVIPLHKSGSLDDMNNFWPISILCTFSKIIERRVFDCFTRFLDSFNLLSPFQSGFRKMHSCETGLTSLNWYNEIDKGNIIGAINIDLLKLLI